MHRPPATLETLLLDYAAGRLGAAESLAVAAALSLNRAAYEQVRRFEAFGGRLIEEEAAAALREGCLEGVLARIDAPCPPCAPSLCSQPPGIPRVLERMLAESGVFEAGRWVRLGRGRERMALRASAYSSARLCLMRMAPGEGTPPHRHRGVEITVVLEGGYSDGHGHYGPGDIVIISDETLVHNPVAGREGCVSLVLTEAPMRFEDPLRRLVNILMRL